MKCEYVPGVVICEKTPTGFLYQCKGCRNMLAVELFSPSALKRRGRRIGKKCTNRRQTVRTTKKLVKEYKADPTRFERQVKFQIKSYKAAHYQKEYRILRAYDPIKDKLENYKNEVDYIQNNLIPRYGKQYTRKQAYFYARQIRNYGISVSSYIAMFNECDGRCMSCWQIKPLCIDHCHETNTVRGLLCRQCNLALGLLRDDPVLAIRLSNYIQDMKEGYPHVQA